MGWRKQSVNPRSLYTCDACGYSYRIQRTAAAAWLQSEGCVWLASSLLVLVLLGVGAAAPLPSELWLYDAARWQPRAEMAWWDDRCDLIVRGAVLPALLGFGYEVRERVRRDDSTGGAFALLAIANFVQSRLGPALLCCCCLYCWCRLSGSLRGVSKRLLLRFGEAVLEVRQ